MTIPGDLPAIEAVIAAHDVKLVIVDVLMAYLAGDVNAHRDQDIRRALHVLSAMADRTGCCVIILRHLNKSRRRERALPRRWQHRHHRRRPGRIHVRP